MAVPARDPVEIDNRARRSQRCTSCGRFMRPASASLCEVCRSVQRPIEMVEASTTTPRQADLDAEPTVRVVPHRLQQNVVIPIPSRIHPERAIRQAASGPLLRTIGPAAAERRRARRFRPPPHILRSVAVLLIIAVAVGAGAIIALVLTTLTSR